MTALPGVSFVVPVYNKAPYLPGVLRQIARQQGDFPRQHIFVDDGSQDGSLDLIRRLTAEWDNVVITSQANRGSAGATNTGIGLADQPFIKFVDADDLIADRATETLLRALDGRQACLAFGNGTGYDDESDLDLSVFEDHPATEIFDNSLQMAMTNSLFNPTQCLARTQAVRDVGGCDERVVHSQEYSLTLRLARRWPLMRVDAPVSFNQNVAADRLSANQAQQLQRVTRALSLFLLDYPDTEPELQRYACRRAAGRAWHYARRRGGAGYLSPWFRHYVRSLIFNIGDAAGFVEACCAAFDEPAP
ncbi:MAG: glycosyltransferase family 2 protein [Alphaproteobacteria bacterium]|nr:glycosyltransferase family 2 protein [Alphaproteobacteria bacterium]